VAVRPDEAQVAALRALVTGQNEGRVVAVLPLAGRTRRPGRQLVAIAAAVLVIVVSAGVVALSARSTDPPAPRAVGLPVDSAVTHARAAIGHLRTALAGPDDAKVVDARDVLVARLRRLSPGDRALVATDADAVLARADARLRPVEIGDATGTSRAPVTTVPTGEVPSGTGTPEATSQDPVTPSATTAPVTTAPAEPEGGEDEIETELPDS
jgi:hypothetical protein